MSSTTMGTRGTRSARTHADSAAQVPQPRGPVQAVLALSGLPSLENVGQRDPRRSPQCPSQQLGLVVSALASSGRVNRHGDQERPRAGDDEKAPQ